MALVTGHSYKSFEAERILGIGDNLIRCRKREFDQEASGAGPSIDGRDELRRLRKENRIPWMEKEILKKPVHTS